MSLTMSFNNCICNHKKQGKYFRGLKPDESLETSTWKSNYTCEALKEAGWSTQVQEYRIQYFQNLPTAA